MTPSREQLLHWLAEAAELEHNLLCSYLFALFSLKEEPDEDLVDGEVAAIGRWRRVLLSVCVEEMSHLAQVANLTVALGGRPHWNRPNLPVAPGHHPGAVVVELVRFERATLNHMVFIERPAEAVDRDAPMAVPRTPPRDGAALTWMPSGPGYETIGAFYEVLREGLVAHARRHGEAALFSGPADVQLRAEEIGGGSLSVVRDLASACAAIDDIVSQGEGGPAEVAGSHYEQFRAMRDEFDRLVAERPGFDPARPVARNPVLHAPMEEGRCHVTAPAARELLDLANSLYGLMLRCLAQTYETRWSAPAARRAICAAAFQCMHAFSVAAAGLTRLPAADGVPLRAGVSFAMLRHIEGTVRPLDAARALRERAADLATAVPQVALPDAARARLADAMAGLAREVDAYATAVGLPAGSVSS